MSELATKKPHTDLERINANLAHMRRERCQLEVRQTAILRTMKRMETRLARCDDVDEVQNLQDIVDNLCSISGDLETYRSHLETELDKVKRGVAMLETLRGKPGKRAFAAYISEDTELSVRNLVQVRSYYDQVIETIRQLKDEPTGY
jgi:predicted RND superfamily exporter protein